MNEERKRWLCAMLKIASPVIRHAAALKSRTPSAFSKYAACRIYY